MRQLSVVRNLTEESNGDLNQKPGNQDERSNAAGNWNGWLAYQR